MDIIKEEEDPEGEGLKKREKNTVRTRIGLVTKSKRDTYKNRSPRIESKMIFFELNYFIFTFLSSSPTIIVV